MAMMITQCIAHILSFTQIAERVSSLRMLHGTAALLLWPRNVGRLQAQQLQKKQNYDRHHEVFKSQVQNRCHALG
jgi:hypothetical protein